MLSSISLFLGYICDVNRGNGNGVQAKYIPAVMLSFFGLPQSSQSSLSSLQLGVEVQRQLRFLDSADASTSAGKTRGYICLLWELLPETPSLWTGIAWLMAHLGGEGTYPADIMAYESRGAALSPVSLAPSDDIRRIEVHITYFEQVRSQKLASLFGCYPKKQTGIPFPPSHFPGSKLSETDLSNGMVGMSITHQFHNLCRPRFTQLSLPAFQKA
jgi:hypothetical protein